MVAKFSNLCKGGHLVTKIANNASCATQMVNLQLMHCSISSTHSKVVIIFAFYGHVWIILVKISVLQKVLLILCLISHMVRKVAS